MKARLEWTTRPIAERARLEAEGWALSHETVRPRKDGPPERVVVMSRAVGQADLFAGAAA